MTTDATTSRRYRAAWRSARRRAKIYSTLADVLTGSRNQWHDASIEDSARARRWESRAERAENERNRYAERCRAAEAALARVRSECHALNSEVRGLAPVALAGRRDAVARIRTAIEAVAR